MGTGCASSLGGDRGFLGCKAGFDSLSSKVWGTRGPHKSHGGCGRVQCDPSGGCLSPYTMMNHGKWLHCHSPAHLYPRRLGRPCGMEHFGADPGHQLLWLQCLTSWMMDGQWNQARGVFVHCLWVPSLPSPCAGWHLLVLQSKSWPCRAAGAEAPAHLPGKFPREQSTSQDLSAWPHEAVAVSAGQGTRAHPHTVTPCILSPARSCRAISRQPSQSKESLSPAEPGVPVLAHTSHTWMQASPAALTLSCSRDSNTHRGAGLLWVLLPS